jgi:hypothetical protein
VIQKRVDRGEDLTAKDLADASRHGEIARLAYKYWEDRGRPIGSPREDWFRADSQVGSQSFAALPTHSQMTSKDIVNSQGTVGKAAGT